jgi:hypothetical protein
MDRKCIFCWRSANWEEWVEGALWVPKQCVAGRVEAEVLRASFSDTLRKTG